MSTKTNEISYVAIYPPIGISRIGNSPEHFLASDLPGVSEVPKGGYKDSKGRIKKEVARFRVYGFNSAGEVIKELTHNETNSIEWRVEVANLKAAWYEFNNALDLGQKYAIPSIRRNSNVVNGYREQLAIKPSLKTISGINTNTPTIVPANKNDEHNQLLEEYQYDDNYSFDDGKFYGKNVDLGHLQTDPEGRLLFFAGDGGAESTDNMPITTFANNNGWHDDTCDGVIRATVKIDGKEFEAKPAMVAVTPPNFGQGLYGVVTMNDVVQNLFIEEMNYPNPSEKGVEFWRDIYPVLERMTNTQWVNEGFYMLFGKNSPSDFTNPKIIEILKNPDTSSESARKRVFEWFRNPESDEYTPEKVPPFYGDGFGDYKKIALDDLPVTVTQYQRLKLWMEGKFTTGEQKVFVPFDKLSPAEQINALNQAPLEDCLGGPFHPGIELTWTMRVKNMWEEPYRLNILPEGEPIQLDFGDLLTPEIALAPDGPCAVNGPGSLTRWMGVPWQTDEASCLSGYTVSTYLPLPSFWAARVPNQVFSEDGYLRMQAGNVNIAQRLKHLDYRQDWLRDIEDDHLKRLENMVEEWNHLGIITKQEKPISNNIEGYLPEVSWVEKGRNFAEEEVDQTFAQVLYAEGDKDSVVKVEEKDEVSTVGSKYLVTSLKHAAEKAAEISAEAPKSNRKRKTMRRDQR
ncbi:LodA/GoxA family CTQ-dependent oxidase [Aquimarina sediminis]|uniref:LodA/GoxA family CTQ-dependent oxidase n=1 Tax=Aquimarina sediminis TaxID=2070536 RepID=UPI000CA07AB5|nr:LodA/GoxA family CTQ-dependent oxidase [Aquimarina sediminis]